MDENRSCQYLLDYYLPRYPSDTEFSYYDAHNSDLMNPEEAESRGE